MNKGDFVRIVCSNDRHYGKFGRVINVVSNKIAVYFDDEDQTIMFFEDDLETVKRDLGGC